MTAKVSSLLECRWRAPRDPRKYTRPPPPGDRRWSDLSAFCQLGPAPCPHSTPLCSFVGRFPLQGRRGAEETEDCALDTITFTVSRPVVLFAIGCQGGSETEVYAARIELRDGDSIQSPLLADGSAEYVHILIPPKPIFLTTPILIASDHAYTIVLSHRQKGPETVYGSGGQDTVHDARLDVIFKFFDTKDRPPASLTTVSYGQISHFYFHLE